MTWARPIPLVGDTTTATARAQDPRGWAFSDRDRDALYAVIAARRDIRRFRPDAVPEDVLTRVLRAGHAGPSVGHSQPWRFIQITNPASRERAAAMADRERLRQASQLEPEAARRLLDLQLEGIREAPLGIVVCCDRRATPTGVLGRATFVDADQWSCACAIENLWLAARAEGLGMGWVTFFDPDELSALLGLPAGVTTLGWLCLGWPDERPPEPGLERAGWSVRQSLSDVILQERWAETPAPVSRLRAPGPDLVVGTRDDADVLLTPPGSLGVLDRAVDRLSALHTSEQGWLVLVGADHPVTAHGVSTYPTHVTRDVLSAAVTGAALGSVTAHAAGLQTLVVDAGVWPDPVDGAINARPLDPQGDLVTTDGLSHSDARRLVDHGQRIGSELTGIVALGEVGIGNTTVATALTCALLGTSDELVGLGAGGDWETLQRKSSCVTAALARARSDNDLVAALGGGEIAVLVGVVLGAAQAGALIVLDGLATTIAAAIAVEREPGARDHLVAGQRSREPAHARLLEHLGLEPVLDLRMRAGEGVGACLAAQLIRTAQLARQSVARTGVGQ